MDSMPVVGAMSSIVVIQALVVHFSVQKCQVVLDYGGYNMVHHRVLQRKLQHVHGHVKQADDAQVQVVLLLIMVPLLVKVNKKQKQFFHNHFAPLHPHQVITIQDLAPVDRIVLRIHRHNNNNHHPIVDHQVLMAMVPPLLVLDQEAEMQEVLDPSMDLAVHQLDR